MRIINMKRSIISLLLAGLFAWSASAALAQNVTAEDQAAKPSKDTVQKEMTNPTDDKAMKDDKDSKHAKGDAQFKKADKDNDGTLDRKEAKAMPRVAKNFTAIDADQDGTVSLDEVHAYMSQHQAATN
jgi:hypothetical protein